MGQIIQGTRVSEEAFKLTEDQSEPKNFVSKNLKPVTTSNKVIQDKKYNKMFMSSDKARDTATWIMTTW